jgi:hypothetical protein
LEVVERTASVGRLFREAAKEGLVFRREDMTSTSNCLPSSRSIVTLPPATLITLATSLRPRVSVNVCNSSARLATAAVGSARYNTWGDTSTAVNGVLMA